MKKSIVYSLLASVSMITTAAYADDPDLKAGVLTTQRYVDDGLEFVYKVANGTENGAVKTLQTDVSNLQTDVGDLADEIGNYSDPNDNTVTPSGIKGDIEALQDTVGNTDLTGIGDGTVTGAISGLDTAINGNGGLDDRVESLDDTVGNTSISGIGDGTITGAISNLKSTVDTLDSLNTDDLDSNKTYVLKTDENGDGSWSELQTVTQWNPTFLTNP